MASSPSPSTLTAKPDDVLRCGNVRDVFITEISTSGGSRDTPMKDWQVMPTVLPSSSRPVTTQTPVPKRPRTSRNARLSVRSIVSFMLSRVTLTTSRSGLGSHSPETRRDTEHTMGHSGGNPPGDPRPPRSKGFPMTGTLTTPGTVLAQVTADRDALFAEGLEADQLGKLADATVARMKDAGVIRMLQPVRYGGMEATPRQFAETVMGIAAVNPSAGWVAGIVGVHPWQLAMADTSVQDDVWGSDADTWMASPYMPNGAAIPVEGGYRMSGRWSFSSGTDHCTWAFLGAMAHEADGSMSLPPRMLHVIIPRTDYEIVEDSWDVVGLRGTGSKDLIVEDAFIPTERVMEYDHLIDGTQI